jgi:hypothetical protein
MSWVADRQTTIYSRVSAILDAKLGDKYDELNVTMDNALSQDAMFPTVYITFVAANERGQTLDGTTINAVNMTVEVHIKTSNAQGMIVNSEVAWEVVEAFKTMGFTAIMPNIPISNIDGVYESVSRFSRLIGQGDVI